MAHVVVKGGTYSGNGFYFEPGTHDVEDPEIIAALQRAELRWVTVLDGPAPSTGEQLELPEPARPALPTPGQKLVAETATAPEAPETMAAKIERVNAPAPEAPPGGYRCPFCADKVLKNQGAQIAHVRHSHPDEHEAWNAARLAAKAAAASE